MSPKQVSDHNSNSPEAANSDAPVEVFEFSDEQLAAGYAALHTLKTVLGPLLASGDPAILKQLQPRLRRLRRVQQRLAEAMATMLPASDTRNATELKVLNFAPGNRTRH